MAQRIVSFSKILLASVVLISGTSISQAKILIVGDSQHPPFSYIEDGSNKGIYTEIVYQTLDRMGDRKSVV